MTACRGQKEGSEGGTPLHGLWQHLAQPGSVLETPSTLEAPAKESCQTPPEAKSEA